MASIARNLRSELEPRFCQSLCQHWKTVVAPERLIFEYEDRHAEDMVRGGFFLRTFIVGCTLALEVGTIFISRETHPRNYRSDLIRIVRYQLAFPEEFINLEIERQQPVMLLREQTTDQRDTRVVDLELTANHQAARRCPAPCVE